MKKIKLIIVILAFLLSFASTFTVNSIIRKKKAAAVVAQQAQKTEAQQANSGQQGNLFDSLSTAAKEANSNTSGISERQLQHLIFDIRNKLK
ncbi:MAG: hypothetical protein ACYSOG_07185, partial [Planctomycetota bacterium]